MILPTRTFEPYQDADTRVPLVCLHGFLGTKDDWADLAARLPHRRVIGIDLPGHGGATGLPDEAYGFNEAVSALAPTLDALGIARCDLLGYSMGGRVALAFALSQPSYINTLILESTSPGLPSDAARAERRALDTARAEALRSDLSAFLDDWYALPLFATLSASQRADMVRDRLRQTPEELSRGLVGMSTGAMPNLWPHLSTLTRPVRLVAGALDAKFAGLAVQIAQRLPDASVHLVPEAGHNVHVEAPDAFAALVR